MFLVHSHSPCYQFIVYIECCCCRFIHLFYLSFFFLPSYRKFVILSSLAFGTFRHLNLTTQLDSNLTEKKKYKKKRRKKTFLYFTGLLCAQLDDVKSKCVPCDHSPSPVPKTGIHSNDYIE